MEKREMTDRELVRFGTGIVLGMMGMFFGLEVLALAGAMLALM